MPLKDWERTKNEKDDIVYKNPSKNLLKGRKLELIFDRDVWSVFLNDEILIQYTNKSQAHSYAKQYMRTH